VTEQQLQQAVIECARTLGWLVAHFRTAKTERGWRTPVEGDGKGFPDLVCVRGGRVIFAELKSSTGRLSDEQTIWISELRLSPAVETYVWEPSRWLDGTIERALR
jgi:hypothetical protein